jgi:hypothetical protein
MSSTNVVIRDVMGRRVPSVPQVSVVPGDTVTFNVEAGADAKLYFAPQTRSILTPSPDPEQSLSYGQTITYAFLSAGAGPYCLIVQDQVSPAPPAFDCGQSVGPSMLIIRPGTDPGFPGQDPTPAR